MKRPDVHSYHSRGKNHRWYSNDDNIDRWQAIKTEPVAYIYQKG